MTGYRLPRYTSWTMEDNSLVEERGHLIPASQVVKQVLDSNVDN